MCLAFGGQGGCRSLDYEQVPARFSGKQSETGRFRLMLSILLYFLNNRGILSGIRQQRTES